MMSGARLLAFEHGELLAQGHRLQRKSVVWQNECPNVRHHWNEQTHRSDHSARRRDRNKQAKCFSLLDDQVLMTHRFANLGNSASLGRREENTCPAVRIATWILNAFEDCDQRGAFHRGVAFSAQSIEN